MVLMRDGRYFMGSDSKHETLRAAVPAHQVVIEALCVDKHEVTAAQYEQCVKDGGCTRVASKVEWPKRRTEPLQTHQRALTLYAEHCNAGKPGRKNHPMNCVTAGEADRYCHYANARLPSEAEWEFAARGSDGRVYPWGDDAPTARHMNGCGGDCQRWHEQVKLDTPSESTLHGDDDGYPGTAPVGSFAAGASPFKALDMIGNVAEWTGDLFAPYAGANAKLDGESKNRVVRGGSFLTVSPEEADAAMRQALPPTTRSPAIGFRCVSTPQK
jgi:formylglycine-generating enzyme required for sulfatase activity